MENDINYTVGIGSNSFVNNLVVDAFKRRHPSKLCLTSSSESNDTYHVEIETNENFFLNFQKTNVFDHLMDKINTDGTNIIFMHDVEFWYDAKEDLYKAKIIYSFI